DPRARGRARDRPDRGLPAEGAAVPGDHRDGQPRPGEPQRGVGTGRGAGRRPLSSKVLAARSPRAGGRGRPAAGARSPQVVQARAGSCSRGTAPAPSRPRISAKTAGTASSAIAPRTQKARSRPPASAAWAVLPPASRALECVAATLEAIAIPIAPPSSWEV